MFDFDTLPDRRGTASLKWDFGGRFAGREGLLPLWVADMDFAAPPAIAEAVARRAAHGVFGYTLEPESYFEAAMHWLADRHGWNVRREWLLAAPGVVQTISAALLAASAPGDRIVIQPPVYYPFALRIRANGREVVHNPLVLDGDRYRMDLEGLERELAAGARMLILCSPHNPGGRAWTGEELERAAGLCARHGAVIVSDEIHADLILPGRRHVPLASVSEAAARITITCVSATKTFNLAGLGGSLAIVRDEGLRERLTAALGAQCGGTANCFAVAASEAAWRHGADWLDAMLAYVAANFAYLADRLPRELPAARVLPLEATYLAWIDLRRLGMPDEEVRTRLLDGGVWLDEGRKFGSGGEGFQRLNLACPRSMLDRAVGGMVRALGGKAGR
jgi:cystathionine beta-lyase